MMAASKKMLDQEPSEIEMLLPFHAAGTLSTRDARRVEDALAGDPELARQYAVIREEYAETISLNESLGAPSTRAMQKLLDDVREGTLDYVLTKPLDAQLLVSVREARVWRLVDSLGGLTIIIYALTQVERAVGLGDVAGFLAEVPELVGQRARVVAQPVVDDRRRQDARALACPA